jgi:hypothetical protein
MAACTSLWILSFDVNKLCSWQSIANGTKFSHKWDCNFCMLKINITKKHTRKGSEVNRLKMDNRRISMCLCMYTFCQELFLYYTCIYSETYIYCSRIICFPGSVVQFLLSLSESYFNYGSCIYCFPGSIVSFSDPQRKRWIEVSLYKVSNNKIK